MSEQPPLRTEDRPHHTATVADWCGEEVAVIGPHVNVNDLDERMAFVQLSATVALLTETLALHRAMQRLVQLVEQVTITPIPGQRRSGW